MAEVNNRTDVVDAARDLATGSWSPDANPNGAVLTPGRIVHYRMGIPRDGREAETSEMRVAICVNITSAGASLKVLSPYDSSSVFRPGVKEGEGIGEWQWPPRA